MNSEITGLAQAQEEFDNQEPEDFDFRVFDESNANNYDPAEYWADFI